MITDMLKEVALYDIYLLQIAKDSNHFVLVLRHSWRLNWRLPIMPVSESIFNVILRQWYHMTLAHICSSKQSYFSTRHIHNRYVQLVCSRSFAWLCIAFPNLVKVRSCRLLNMVIYTYIILSMALACGICNIASQVIMRLYLWHWIK